MSSQCSFYWSGVGTLCSNSGQYQDEINRHRKPPLVSLILSLGKKVSLQPFGRDTENITLSWTEGLNEIFHIYELTEPLRTSGQFQVNSKLNCFKKASRPLMDTKLAFLDSVSLLPVHFRRIWQFPPVKIVFHTDMEGRHVTLQNHPQYAFKTFSLYYRRQWHHWSEHTQFFKTFATQSVAVIFLISYSLLLWALIKVLFFPPNIGSRKWKNTLIMSLIELLIPGEYLLLFYFSWIQIYLLKKKHTIWLCGT